MCGCGRKRTEQVTSVQAAQLELEAQAATLARMEADAVREAEAYVVSAANAARNASSD